MDGYAGQQVIIDMDNKRILIVNTIDEHYNWNKKQQLQCINTKKAGPI